MIDANHVIAARQRASCITLLLEVAARGQGRSPGENANRRLETKPQYFRSFTVKSAVLDRAMALGDFLNHRRRAEKVVLANRGVIGDGAQRPHETAACVA